MIFSFLPKGSFKTFGKKGMPFWQVWGEVFSLSASIMCMRLLTL